MTLDCQRIPGRSRSSGSRNMCWQVWDGWCKYKVSEHEYIIDKRYDLEIWDLEDGASSR